MAVVGEKQMAVDTHLWSQTAPQRHPTVTALAGESFHPTRSCGASWRTRAVAEGLGRASHRPGAFVSPRVRRAVVLPAGAECWD